MQQRTPQVDEEQPGIAAEACPNCGMTREDWRGNGGQGYDAGGVVYCCQGCAEGNGCTCTP